MGTDISMWKLIALIAVASVASAAAAPTCCACCTDGTKNMAVCPTPTPAPAPAPAANVTPTPAPAPAPAPAANTTPAPAPAPNGTNGTPANKTNGTRRSSRFLLAANATANATPAPAPAPAANVTPAPAPAPAPAGPAPVVDTCSTNNTACVCPTAGGAGTKSGFFVKSSFTASITTAAFVANYAANVVSTKTTLVAGATAAKMTGVTAATTFITSPYPTAAGRRAGAVIQYYFSFANAAAMNAAAVAYTAGKAAFQVALNTNAALCGGGCTANNAYAATFVKDNNPANIPPAPTPPTTVSPAAQTTSMAIASTVALVLASLYFTK